jgi:beta-glucanase (GH16 family)
MLWLSDEIEYRYSNGECPSSRTRVEIVHILEERFMTMINSGNSRFVLRFSIVLAIVFLSLAGGSRANAQGSDCASNSVPNDPQGNVVWVPAFCQEFNSTIVGPPDITVWNFDLGNSGFGNNEIETYCGPPNYPMNPTSCPTTFLPSTSNAYIDGSGHLIIQAFKSSGGNWYSARMTTQKLESFTYGRIEARIQLPDTTNQGLWPAFWSLGANITSVNWPTCGEDDFMEVWSPTLGGPGTGGNIATIHTKNTDGAGVQTNKHPFTFPSGMANNTRLHKYGVIWSANMVQHYVDDPTHPFYIATISDLGNGDLWPFNSNSFILLNLAVGGNLGGSTTGLASPTQPYLVDYVRRYTALASVAPPVLPAPPSITVKAGDTSGVTNTSKFTPGLTSGTGFVFFTCTTNAPKASCSVGTSDPVSPFVVNSSPSGAPETVTVTVTTTANAIVPPFFLDPRMRIWMPITIAGVVALLIMVLALRTQGRARRQLCGIAAVLILVGIAIAGCGGNSAPPPPPPPPNGTPPGSYTVTVYAFTESNMSDGTNATADANVAIPLTVN